MQKERLKKQLKKQIAQTRALYMASMTVSLVAFVLLLWFGIRASIDWLAEERAAGDGFSFFSETDTDACDYRRLLDGICVGSAKETMPRLVAVMIENHPDARPQSGLARASVVYEVPVEANYSRFLALYPEDADVAKAGPVRSARPYYLDWVREYGQPVYMHVGGSPDALSELYTGGFFDINEMGRGWYFWRSADRYAPHNTYTSTRLWQDAVADYWEDDTQTAFPSWHFSTEDECKDTCVYEITVSFLSPDYIASWKYDTEHGRYARFQSGVPHVDQDGEPILAGTVIVQRVETRVIDEVGRLSMETVGDGEAIVFRGGHMIPARWRKAAKSDRTMWLDADGNEIALEPGVIWIEVANQRGNVTWKESDVSVMKNYE